MLSDFLSSCVLSIMTLCVINAIYAILDSV
jgi:hypothetical protein